MSESTEWNREGITFVAKYVSLQEYRKALAVLCEYDWLSMSQKEKLVKLFKKAKANVDASSTISNGRTLRTGKEVRKNERNQA